MNMTRKAALRAILPTLLALGWLVVSLVEMVSAPPHHANRTHFTPTITISDPARVHILYGDRSGGGHIHGANIPCKSEFPADWSANDIIDNIKSITANDNTHWRKEHNGYHVAEHIIDGIQVRVVLNKSADSVITAYPLNVRRNPCPANDNTWRER